MTLHDPAINQLIEQLIGSSSEPSELSVSTIDACAQCSKLGPVIGMCYTCNKYMCSDCLLTVHKPNGDGLWRKCAVCATKTGHLLRVVPVDSGTIGQPGSDSDHSNDPMELIVNRCVQCQTDGPAACVCHICGQYVCTDHSVVVHRITGMPLWTQCTACYEHNGYLQYTVNIPFRHCTHIKLGV